MIHLGMKVTDQITGYSGTVTARAHYLDGRECYLVEGIDSTGRPIEIWTEAYRLAPCVPGFAMLCQ